MAWFSSNGMVSCFSFFLQYKSFYLLIIVNLPDSSASPYDVHRIFGFKMAFVENSIISHTAENSITHYRERTNNISFTGSIEQRHVTTLSGSCPSKLNGEMLPSNSKLIHYHENLKHSY